MASSESPRRDERKNGSEQDVRGYYEPEILLDQRSKPGRKGYLECIALAASLALMAFSSFMIVVGRCSRPMSKTTKHHLCHGNHFAVQTWLAIVGIEFAIFGTILLPRLQTLTIAKKLTKRLLSEEGVPLSSILNLQAGAPLKTQVREGMSRALFRQILIPVLVTAGSVSYKFSFVTMSIPSIIQLDCGLVPLGEHSPGWTVFSDNMIDIAEPDRVEAISTGRNGSDLILGPSFNYSRMDAALYGSRLHLCYPTLYARSTTSTTNDPTQFPKPTANQSIIQSEIQFASDVLGQVVELSVTGSQTLQALAGSSGTNLTTDWKYFTNITTTICWGYITWTKLERTVMDNPQDIMCINERFDLNAWSLSKSHVVANGVVQSRLALKNSSSPEILSIHLRKDKTDELRDNTAYFLNIVVKTLLASINHTAVLDELFPQVRDGSDLHESPSEACSSKATIMTAKTARRQNGVMIVDGVIENAGIGMTAIGFILQIFLLIASICGLGIFIWPSLLLVQEWPAQWITLVSQLDGETLEKALVGTSTGENVVAGIAGTVYLTSKRNEQNGHHQLVLTRERGSVRKEIPHA